MSKPGRTRKLSDRLEHSHDWQYWGEDRRYSYCRLCKVQRGPTPPHPPATGKEEPPKQEP